LCSLIQPEVPVQQVSHLNCGVYKDSLWNSSMLSL
jgi:hypothetical protein